jgi:hypothetical protein
MISIRKRVCNYCPQCNSDDGLNCFWQIEKAVPEKFKPEDIFAYITVENINGLGFLKATEIDKDFDTEFLSWFVTFCVGKNLNAFWKTKAEPFCIGSPEFVETAWRSVGEGLL